MMLSHRHPARLSHHRPTRASQFSVGAVIGAIAVDALRHHPARRDLSIAFLPVILALHSFFSFIAAFVWWSARGQSTR